MILAMLGMLSPAQPAVLERYAGEPAFDPLSVNLITHHHQGAIVMADEALRNAGDPRLMAPAIRQAQRGEILLMHGIPRGFTVSRAAAMALLAPAGTHPAEHGPTEQVNDYPQAMRHLPAAQALISGPQERPR
jgi:hypothetical protein